jgi:hypothetical protein
MKKYAVLIGLIFFLVIIAGVVFIYNARIKKLKGGMSVSPVVVDVLPQISTYTKPNISKKEIEEAKQLGKEGKIVEVTLDKNGKEINRKETKSRY